MEAPMKRRIDDLIREMVLQGQETDTFYFFKAVIELVKEIVDF